MSMQLIPIKIERVIAGTNEEFAVVLRAPTKLFFIFVGHAEALAIYRELKDARSRRPLPHDLVVNLLRGFELTMVSVAISSIVDGTFCATLLVRQEASAGARARELRLDVRASDAMILALKCGRQLWATTAVIDTVEDVTEILRGTDENDGGLAGDAGN